MPQADEAQAMQAIWLLMLLDEGHSCKAIIVIVMIIAEQQQMVPMHMCVTRNMRYCNECQALPLLKCRMADVNRKAGSEPRDSRPDSGLHAEAHA